MKETQLLHYTCTAQSLRDEDGNPRRAYRFSVLDVSGEQPRLLCAVNDICSSEEQARQLEDLFRRNGVSPGHVTDVLEDWLV